MKKRSLALLLAFVMLLSVAASGAVSEGGTQTVRSAQTAESPDPAGTLSFGSIEERMKSANPSVLALEENIAAINCIDYAKMESDLREGLNQIANAQWMAAQFGGDTYTNATLSSQYETMHDLFDDLREGKLQKDNAGIVHQLKNLENTMTTVAESIYVAILSAERQDAALTRQLAAMDRTLRELSLRYDLGQISALTLRQAELGKTQLQSGQDTLRMSIRQLYRQLAAFVGTDLTEKLTLQALPAVTAEQLAAMNAEADLEKAKAESYTLYAAAKTLEDADETYQNAVDKYGAASRKYEFAAEKHKWAAAQYTYQASVQDYELSFRSLYEKVHNYAQILEASRIALQSEQANFAADELRYQQGTVSANVYAAAKDDLAAAEDSVVSAEYDLFTAYHNYCWAVEFGLLNG